MRLIKDYVVPLWHHAAQRACVLAKQPVGHDVNGPWVVFETLPWRFVSRWCGYRGKHICTVRLDLFAPVKNDRRWAYHKWWKSAATLGHGDGQGKETLHRLAQAHVIAKQPMQTHTLHRNQPRNALFLVRAQIDIFEDAAAEFNERTRTTWTPKQLRQNYSILITQGPPICIPMHGTMRRFFKGKQGHCPWEQFICNRFCFCVLIGQPLYYVRQSKCHVRKCRIERVLFRYT